MQYPSDERIIAGVAVRNVVAPEPQPKSVRRFRSMARDVSFLRSDSRCRRYVSFLSNVTPLDEQTVFLRFGLGGRQGILKDRNLSGR